AEDLDLWCARPVRLDLALGGVDDTPEVALVGEGDVRPSGLQDAQVARPASGPPRVGPAAAAAQVRSDGGIDDALAVAAEGADVDWPRHVEGRHPDGHAAAVVECE